MKSRKKRALAARAASSPVPAFNPAKIPGNRARLRTRAEQPRFNLLMET